MKKTILSSIIRLSLIFILLMSATLPSAVAYAVDGDVAPNYVYDKTDVAKDLEGSDGFDFADYPADASKDTQIYTFLEYGYDGTDNSKFGLYLYIYNPQQKDFSRSSASNKANVAVAFDEKDNASSYQRVNLIFCSATSDKLFYKYRIDDSDGKLLALAEQYAITHAGARRYDVATVELFAYGNTTATTTSIGKSYECAGYMKGFGADKASNTHTVKAYSIDVLDIELKHTFFRPEGTNYGNFATEYFHQSSKDQLDSVYFSFPDELISYYGGIWKINAGFVKMETRPIIVTSTKEVYENALNYVGRNDRDNCSVKISSTYPKKIGNQYIDNLKGYSDEIKEEVRKFLLCDFPSTPIYYLFYTGNETADGSVPYAKDFSLSGERLLKYTYNYKRSYDSGVPELKDGNISKDLFSYTPEHEKAGYGQYSNIEVKADDSYTLENMSRVKHWYDFLDFFGMSAEYQSDAYRNIQAIEPIDKRDILLSKTEFCKKYFVSESDYDSIIQSVNKTGETTYLFRFAQSSFSALGLSSQVGDGYEFDTEYNYCATETVYLDMNISSITCRKGDEYHTFAVASNPIDVAADIDPPPEEFDNTGWWKDIMAKIKEWFEDNKKELIISAIVIVCVLIAICIISLLVKLAPYFAMQSMKRSQSPPKPKRQSKPKRQRQSKPHKNKSNKKTAQKAGRRKHGN